ncbi:MAG: hypothetical protein JJE51_13800 [Thermoanaerobaculia bacterium]|nr:hypothetical protein [Thermoanaerobaculia bacterium]
MIIRATQSDLDDFLALIEDLNELSALPITEMIALLKADESNLWTDIPVPGGGHVSVRQLSFKGFQRLADRLIGTQPRPFDFSREAVERKLREEFGRAFVGARMMLTQDTAEAVLRAALAAALDEHRSVRHFIPCVALSATRPAEFRIGHVRFITRERFFSEHHQHFEEKRKYERSKAVEGWKRATDAGQFTVFESEEHANEMGDTGVKWVTDFYSQHGWVAEILIPNCHPDRSEERAELATQAALDVLKLLFGRYYSRHVRLGTSPALPEKTAGWKQVDEGRFEIHMSRQGEDILVEDEWLSRAGSHERYYIRLAGLVIAGYVDPARRCDVGNRFLDALHWFGEAVSERLVSAATVKYASALERMTVTPDVGAQFTRTVVRRVSIVASAGDAELFEELAPVVRSLYTLRSEFMHGRRSPHDAAAGVSASYVVGRMLFRFLDLIRILARKGTVTDVDLAAEYRRLEALLN